MLSKSDYTFCHFYQLSENALPTSIIPVYATPPGSAGLAYGEGDAA